MGMLKVSDFNPPEDSEQEAVIEWSRYDKRLKWLHHCPNGGSRNKAEAVKLQRMGVKAGVSDLFLPVAVGGYHGLYVEMKRRKGGTLTERQREFLEDMRAAGYAAVVAHGADEAVRYIEEYINGELRVIPEGPAVLAGGEDEGKRAESGEAGKGDGCE